MNRPIYKDVEVHQKIEYGILEEVRMLKVDSNQSTMEYTITLRDTELNRQCLTLNKKINVKGTDMNVIGFNYIRSGIMVVTLRH